MIQREELVQRLRQRPFKPFRVHLSDGRAFDIVYPDINIVGFVDFHIGIPEPNVPDPFAERFEMIELSLLREIEPLPVSGTAVFH